MMKDTVSELNRTIVNQARVISGLVNDLDQAREQLTSVSETCQNLIMRLREKADLPDEEEIMQAQAEEPAE